MGRNSWIYHLFELWFPRSPKSSPKVSRGRQTASSVASSSLRSTAPAGPISSSSGRGKEKLSSTTTAVSNGHSGNREGRGDRERRGRPAGREEVREKLSASHSKSSEKKSSSDRVPATRDQRERAGQGKEGIRDKRSSERAVRREDDGRGGREHGSRSRKEGERREQHEISRRVREGTPPPPSAPLVGAQSGPRFDDDTCTCITYTYIICIPPNKHTHSPTYYYN